MKKSDHKKLRTRLLSAVTAVSMALTAVPLLADAAFFSRVSVHDPSVVKLEDGSYYMSAEFLKCQVILKTDEEGNLIPGNDYLSIIPERNEASVSAYWFSQHSMVRSRRSKQPSMGE